MENILKYLYKKYNPTSLVVFGSYADNTQNGNSDFDCLVISNDDVNLHDTSIVDFVRLDVMVYPKEFFECRINYGDFVGIYDSKIMFDSEKIGENLKNGVINYVENYPKKSKREKQDDVNWCYKMLKRSKHKDIYGYFRHHDLLIQSLEIYCNVEEIFYFGPKKTIIYMQNNDEQAYELYYKALSSTYSENLQRWIDYIDDKIV